MRMQWRHMAGNLVQTPCVINFLLPCNLSRKGGITFILRVRTKLAGKQTVAEAARRTLSKCKSK